MKVNYTEKKESALPNWIYIDPEGNKKHKDLCHKCKLYFIPIQYNSAAHFCVNCSSDYAAIYGINYENISFAQVAEKNLPWYKTKLRTLQNSDREFIRGLMLATEIPVNRPTPREEDLASELRQNCLGLTKKTPSEIGEFLADRMRDVF